MASRRCPFSTPPDPPGLLEVLSSSAFFGCRLNFQANPAALSRKHAERHFSPIAFRSLLSEQKWDTLDHKPGRETLHIRSQVRRVPIRKLTSFRSANSRLYSLAH